MPAESGGARGIGRYAARTFASEGAKLVIADLASMEYSGEQLIVRDGRLEIATD